MRLHNEKGNALLMVVLVLMLLTTAGIYGTRSAMVELDIAGSAKRGKQHLHLAERGMQFAIANLEDLYYNNDSVNATSPIYAGDPDTASDGGILYWEDTSNFDNSKQTTALRDMNPRTEGIVFRYSTDPNPAAGDPIASAVVEIRAIIQADVDIVNLSDEANNVPSMLHIGNAPEYGSEYKTRRYAITSTAIDPISGDRTNTSIQSGVEIIEEKKKIEPWIGVL